MKCKMHLYILIAFIYIQVVSCQMEFDLRFLCNIRINISVKLIVTVSILNTHNLLTFNSRNRKLFEYLNSDITLGFNDYW